MSDDYRKLERMCLPAQGTMSTSMRAGCLCMVLAMGILLVYCTGSSVDEPEGSVSTPEPTEAWIRGSLVWGHEVRTFTECGSDQESWIIDETGGQIRQMVETTTSRSYEAVMVEILAVRGPALETGFGADYDHSLVVAEVRSKPDSECQGPT